MLQTTDVEPNRTIPVVDAQSVQAVVGSRRGRRVRRIIVSLVLLAITGAAVLGVRKLLEEPPAAPVYETAEVSRGDIDETVEATGTLEARRVVSVGAEISGRVATVEVEVNEHVTKGQVIATLDPASLEHALTEAKGSLAVTRVEVTRAAASLEAAELTETRVTKLHTRNVASDEDLDNARSSLRLAKAELQRAKSERSLAATRVRQAETNRDKATIVAPIDGVVLTRRIEPGNAIAASLEAPVLFTIAEDLQSMRLDLGVDEADIGKVAAGQSATFTVDAWPGRTFEASVERVDFAPSGEDSAVVTYTTVLSVSNDDGRLRPGMTASATILSSHHGQVLRVPAAALYFDPSQVMPADLPELPKGGSPFGMPGPPPSMGGKKGPVQQQAPTSGSGGTIWVLDDGQPRPLPVSVGASDGRFVEVSGEGLEEGLEVITSGDMA